MTNREYLESSDDHLEVNKERTDMRVYDKNGIVFLSIVGNYSLLKNRTFLILFTSISTQSLSVCLSLFPSLSFVHSLSHFVSHALSSRHSELLCPLAIVKQAVWRDTGSYRLNCIREILHE